MSRDRHACGKLKRNRCARSEEEERQLIVAAESHEEEPHRHGEGLDMADVKPHARRTTPETRDRAASHWTMRGIVNQHNAENVRNDK